MHADSTTGKTVDPLKIWGAGILGTRIVQYICLVNNYIFDRKAFQDETMSSTKMLLAEIAKTFEPLIFRL